MAKERNPYCENNPAYFDRLLRLVYDHPRSFQTMLRATGVHFDQVRYRGAIRKYRKYDESRDNTRLLEWVNVSLPKLSDPVYSLATKCHWILNGLTDFPVCPICGTNTNYIGKNVKIFEGYSRHCSHDCANRDKDVYAKGRQTKLERYGDASYVNAEKISATYWAKPDGERKRLADGVRRRVSERPPEEKQNIRWKREVTSLRKYGVAVCCNLEKSKWTCLEKYGSPHFAGSDVHKAIFKNLSLVDEMVRKQIETKRRNKTFKVSSKEDYAFEKLCLVFPDLIRQYRSDAYPFLCDFYSPAFDLYIEFNGTWTHGGHEFNPCDSNDVAKLNAWREKASTSKYYGNAVNNWTIRDKIKFDTVRKNNLNHIVFWTISEVDEYVGMFFEKFVSNEGK